MEELFTSNHFYEAGGGQADDKFGALVKSPLELIIGTLNYFELALLPRNTPEHNYMANQWLGLMADMGLNLMNPYDVAGYEAYHQAPGYNRNWITTNTLANRYAFIHRLLNNQLEIKVNLLDWANNAASGVTDSIATTLEVVNERPYALPLVQHLAGRLPPYAQRNTTITAERYTYFAEYHLGGLDFANWKFTWENRNGGNPDISTDAEARLRNLFNALMQSPEYQLY